MLRFEFVVMSPTVIFNLGSSASTFTSLLLGQILPSFVHERALVERVEPCEKSNLMSHKWSVCISLFIFFCRMHACRQGNIFLFMQRTNELNTQKRGRATQGHTKVKKKCSTEIEDQHVVVCWCCRLKVYHSIDCVPVRMYQANKSENMISSGGKQAEETDSFPGLLYLLLLFTETEDRHRRWDNGVCISFYRRNGVHQSNRRRWSVSRPLEPIS